jgi:hypothetical protein
MDRNNPQHIDNLLNEWYYHSDLIPDYGLELTRSGNYIIQVVRNTIFSKFLFDEGALLYYSDKFKRTEYKKSDLDKLYPGISDFFRHKKT